MHQDSSTASPRQRESRPCSTKPVHFGFACLLLAAGLLGQSPVIAQTGHAGRLAVQVQAHSLELGPSHDRLEADPATLPDYADEWYLPTSDAVKLLVREYGQGELFVVLHGGWGAEHEYMVGVLRSEFSRNRFVLYDQRGSMRSPARVATISVDAHVEDLERLRVELGLERMNLVGHSMGTFLAQRYLVTYPEHVGKLVLIASTPPRMEAGNVLAAFQEDSMTMLERPEVAEVLEAEGLAGDELNARQATHAWRVQFASVNLYNVDRWRSLEGGRVFFSQVASSAAGKTMPDGWDFMPVLRDHPHTITVIAGDHDFVDMGNQRWWEVTDELPTLKLRILANTGHAPWIDSPTAFRTALRSGLAGD
jgi:proline iminopeptidase